MKKNLFVIVILFLAISCSDNKKLFDKSKLNGFDYDLFVDTPVWELAQAVRDQRIDDINRIIKENKVDINYQESKFGETLLMMSIMNKQYNSCLSLLENGANPNIHDTYDGSSAIIEAAQINGISDDNTRFLRLLLKYKADPNDIQIGKRPIGSRQRYSALMATLQGNNVISPISKVKLLVEAGADVNYQNEFGVSVLSVAATLDFYDVVLFLLQNGADYKTVLLDLSKDSENGKKFYLVDYLRDYIPELNSKEHKTKMEIVKFLKQKGIDYRSVPIPENTLKEIKETYPNNWKEYIEKY
jgi:ankyrin repeat protein